MGQQDSGNTGSYDKQEIDVDLEKNRQDFPEERGQAIMAPPIGSDFEDYSGFWEAAAAAARGLFGGTTHLMGRETAYGESSSYHKQRDESRLLGTSPAWRDAALNLYGRNTEEMEYETVYVGSSSYHKQSDESPFLGSRFGPNPSWNLSPLMSAGYKHVAATLDRLTGTTTLSGVISAANNDLGAKLDLLCRTATFPRMTSRVSECITCKRQFASEKGFCACHRKLTPVIDGHKSQLKSSPVKARPGSSSSLPNPTRSNLSGGGTSTMPNHSSSGEVVGIEMEGMHSPGRIRLDHAGGATLPNVSDESTSEPSQPDLFNRDHGEPNRALNVPSKDTDVKMRGMPSSDRVQGGPTLVLRGDSSSPGFADEGSDVEMRGMHSSDGVQGGPTLVLRVDSSSMGGTPSSDRVQGGPTLMLRGDSSSDGFADEDSDVEMRGTHSSDGVQGGPTLVPQVDSSSHGFADEEGDIETGCTHSSDGVPSERSSVDSSSDHPPHGDTRWRLATRRDLLLTVSAQGACSLVAYNGSDGSSPAKDVLFFLVVFSFVLGFLSAIVGQLYRGSKMVVSKEAVSKVAVIGWVATAVGFLLTMALVVICKIW